MKKFKAAIFDMDGTLLDSMSIWRTLVPAYMKRNNIPIPPELQGKISTMGLNGAAKFIIENLNLNVEHDKIIEEFFEILADFYKNEAVLKPGTENFLKKLQERNISTVVFSATPQELLAPVLERLNIKKYFTHGLLSCSTINHTKYEQEAFFLAAEHLGAAPDEVVVFEDAWYAASTAKKAGFTLGIIADDIEPRTAEMRELADFYVEENWDEFPVDNFF